MVKALALFSILAVFSGACATPDTSNSKNGFGGSWFSARRNYLTDVKSFTSQDKTMIRFTGETPIKYYAYRMDNPIRLAVEMDNMGFSLASPLVIVNDALVEKVSVFSFEKAGKTRAEILMKQPYTCDMEKDGASLYITIRQDTTSDTAMLFEAKKTITQLTEEIEKLRLILTSGTTPAQPPLEPDNPQETPVEAAVEPSPQKDEPKAGPAEAEDPRLGVMASLIGWKDGWSARDFGRYSFHYAETFQGDGLGRAEWLAEKQKKISKAKDIKISISDVEIDVIGETAHVRFIQRYSSGRHTDSGLKNMTMVKTHDGWKIESEDWRPIGR
ncbi:MAG: nuclear transport factor 2 family protein [Nitrospinae bacterium]|nr:nuclear transport factor 2 family protein [Nitrospinota bacterium]